MPNVHQHDHSLGAAGLLVIDSLSPYISQQWFVAALNSNIFDAGV